MIHAILSKCQAELAQDFMTAFIKLQKLEWAEFTAHLSNWELAQTLDC